jgi:hypothetical protein
VLAFWFTRVCRSIKFLGCSRSLASHPGPVNARPIPPVSLINSTVSGISIKPPFDAQRIVCRELMTLLGIGSGRRWYLQPAGTSLDLIKVI